uniref:HVA22-like protein n=1 Tax=Davidia involucrata TaxID=16924 RepID=A0A5B7A6Q8_DAVIN
MLGDFITRGLVLVLGYAYPAFECFKTVEKNRVEIEELRFWCQYWIIVALLTVFERIGDIFISWLPMYGEMKLVLFIYLWYPKTKGTGYVYETFLRPYVAKHETDIDRNIQELRARAWDLTIYYWQNCAKMGQTTLFQMIQYLASQSGRITNTTSEKAENHHSNEAPPPSPNAQSPFHRASKLKQPSDKKRPPLPPQPPTMTNRSMARTPKSNAVQVHLHSQTEFIKTEDESVTGSTTDESETGLDHNLQAVRLRLRRSKGIH